MGTAYVRIRAVTAGLSDDIKSGFDKGVKDAKVGESGSQAGKDFSKGYGDGLEGSLPDTLDKSVGDATKKTDFEGHGKDGGSRHAKGFGDGVDEQNKRKNPFRSFLDSFHKAVSGGDAETGGRGFTKGFTDGVENEAKGRDPFDPLTGSWDDFLTHAKTMARGGGTDVSKGFTKGFGDENERNNPFDPARATWQDFLGHAKERARGGGTEVSRGFTKGFADGMDDGSFSDHFDASVSKSTRQVNFERHGKDGGHRWGKGFGDGVDEESKKKNPFKPINDAYDKFTKTFFGKIPGGGLLSTLFLPDFTAAIAPGVAAALAGVTAGVGYLATAAAGAGVALAGIFATALPGIGVLVAALKAATPELEAFKKVAKELVKPWTAVAEATQKTFLPGILNLLDSVKVLIPRFKTFGQTIGLLANNFLTNAGATLTSATNQEHLNTILGHSEKFWGNVLDAAGSVVDVIMPFFAAVSPLATRFSETLKTLGQHLKDFVETKGVDGLTTTFSTWYDRLSAVVSIVANVAKALWNILTVGGDAADGVVTKIEDVTKKWADWTSSLEGKNAIKEWFDKAAPLLTEIWGLATDIWNIFLQPLVIGGGEGADGALLAFVKVIREDVLPILADFSAAVSEPAFRDAIGAFATSLGGLFKTVSDEGGASTFGTIMDIVGKAIQGLADILATPAGKEIGKSLILAAAGLVAVAKVSKLVKPIAEGFSTLKGIVASLLGMGPVGWVLLAIAAAITAVWAVWHYFDQITEGLKAAYEWFNKLSPVMKIFVGALGGLVLLSSPLLLFAAAVYAVVYAIKNWATIGPKVGEAIQSILDGFSHLGETIGNFVNSLNWSNVTSGIVEGLGTAILGALTGLRAIFTSLLEHAPTWILQGLSALARVGLEIIKAIATGIATAAPEIAKAIPQILAGLLLGLAKIVPKLLVFFITLPFKLMTALRKGLIDALPLVISWFKKLPRYIIDGIDAAGAWLLSTGVAIVQGLWDGLKKAGPVLLQAGKELLSGLWDGIQEIWKTIDEFFGGLPGAIGTAVAGAATWLWQTGSDILSGLLDGIEAGAEAVWTWFTNLPTTIGNLLTSAASWLVDTGTSILTGLLDGIVAGATALWNWFTNLPITLSDLLLGQLSAFIYIGSHIPLWILEGIGSVIELLWDVFRTLPSKILDLVLAGAAIVTDIGTKILHWILDGITAVVTELWDFFTALPGKVVDLITAGFGVLIEVGSSVLRSIRNGVVNVAEELYSWARELPGKIASAITGALSAVLEAGKSILRKIKEGVEAVADELLAWGRELPGKILSAVTGALSVLYGAGTQIVDKIKEGIEAVTDTVLSWGRALPGKLVSAITGALGGLYDVGRAIVNKIVDGIGSMGSAIANKLKSLVPSPSDILGAFNPFGAQGSVLLSLVPTLQEPMIPALANGIITTRPMLAQIGEAGREAVIPLTNPTRAMALARTSGLSDMVLEDFLKQLPNTGPSEVTVLHIEEAHFADKVDVDMVASRILDAYRAAVA